MLKDKTHHPLDVRLEPGPAGRMRLLFGPSTGNCTFALEVSAGGPEVQVRYGEHGRPFIAFRLPDGSYHFFTEVEAKAAAKECLGLSPDSEDRHTRDYADQFWSQGRSPATHS